MISYYNVTRRQEKKQPSLRKKNTILSGMQKGPWGQSDFCLGGFSSSNWDSVAARTKEFMEPKHRYYILAIAIVTLNNSAIITYWYYLQNLQLFESCPSSPPLAKRWRYPSFPNQEFTNYPANTYSESPPDGLGSRTMVTTVFL